MGVSGLYGNKETNMGKIPKDFLFISLKQPHQKRHYRSTV